MFTRAAFDLDTANESTRAELFYNNVKYHQLYVELLLSLEILNLLHPNPDIRSYILNDFKSVGIASGTTGRGCRVLRTLQHFKVPNLPEGSLPLTTRAPVAP